MAKSGKNKLGHRLKVFRKGHSTITGLESSGQENLTINQFTCCTWFAYNHTIMAILHCSGKPLWELQEGQ